MSNRITIDELECVCNFRNAITVYIHLKYPSYRSRGFFVDNPFFPVVRIFLISERGIRRKMLA